MAFSDSCRFIIPRSALQVDPAVRKLSSKRQNGHFWVALARRIETSVNIVMVVVAEEQDVDARMDEELLEEERSARVEGNETQAHQRSDQPTRESNCRIATGVLGASCPERPTQATESLR